MISVFNSRTHILRRDDKRKIWADQIVAAFKNNNHTWGNEKNTKTETKNITGLRSLAPHPSCRIQ